MIFASRLFRVANGAMVAAMVLARATSLAGEQAAAPQACQAEYVIGPEDVLDIAVWNNTEISRTVPVRPDGKISLPLLNDVQAAGLTPMQMRNALAESLAAYIASPIVSVIVQEIHSFKVTVLGEVKTPGRYELKSRSTVLDVLAIAGGPTDYAGHERIMVLRQVGASTEQIPFSLEKATEKLNSDKRGSPNRVVNPCLMPGDIVLVP